MLVQPMWMLVQQSLMLDNKLGNHILYNWEFNSYTHRLDKWWYNYEILYNNENGRENQNYMQKFELISQM